MKEKVSVIVPIYDVEKYIDRCITSIINQTYVNLEIILVDDGSPDRCPEICDDWARRDDRIQVIHKENGGLSSARNAGIDASTGEYITFVDSDDVINLRMISFLHEVMKKSNADISLTSMNPFNTIPIFDSENDEVIIGTSDEILYEIIYKKPNWEACGKLYKKSIFNSGLRFPENRLYEDLYLTPRIFKKAKKVACCNNGLYAYFQREDSIMGKTKKKISLDLIEVIEENILFIKENYEKHTQTYDCLFARFAIHPSTLLELIEKNKCYLLNKDYIKAYKKFISRYWGEVKSNSYISKKYKIGLFLSMHSTILYNKIFILIRFLQKNQLINWKR